MKVCTICKGDPKPLNQFNKNSTRKDGHQSHCRECGKKHAKRYYKANKSVMVSVILAKRKERIQENQKRIVEFLREHPCVDCGESDIVVLDFDHVSGTKTGNISTMMKMGASWSSIEVEIQKCVLRCANCHRRKTAKQLGYYRALIPGSSNGRTSASETDYGLGSIPPPGTGDLPRSLFIDNLAGQDDQPLGHTKGSSPSP